MSPEERKQKKRLYNKKYNSNPENRKKKLERAAEYRKKPEVIEMDKKWREENREYLRQYHIKTKDRRKAYKIKMNYGLSFEEYNRIILAQNNLCPICKNPLEENRGIHVDHNHDTKIVRGVLCRSCNILLGYAYDNVLILSSAIDYLNTHKNV